MRARHLGRLVVAVALAGRLFLEPALAQDASAQAEAIEVQQAKAWLASLKNQLQLTGDQEKAFQAYAAAISDQAKKVAHRTAALFVDAAELPAAPQALTVKVEQLRERVAALANVRDAAAALYEVLGTEQRTVLNFLAVTPMGVGTFEPL
jgi:LTXXQ motif family protein